MDLFVQNAPWQGAAKKIQVFKIYPEWLDEATNQQLQSQFQNLKSRGIALALEFGAVTRASNCNGGIVGEGAGGQELVAAAKRIQENGGDLKYIAMDEPLYFTGLATLPTSCSLPVSWVAANAASNLLPVRSVFPSVQFGDIEPIGATKLPFAKELARYQAGLDAFRKSLGEPLAFFHADVNWNSPTFESDLKALDAMLASEQVTMGVIYDGLASATSNAVWIQDTQLHIQQAELAIGIPAAVIFQSWHKYPQKLLPETDSDSFTYLVLHYALRPGTPTHLAGSVQSF